MNDNPKITEYISVTLQVCSLSIESEKDTALRKKQNVLIRNLSFEESWRAFDIIHQTLSVRLDF